MFAPAGMPPPWRNAMSEKGREPLPEPTAAPRTWRRSSYCSDSVCVEISLDDGDLVLMRDSKNTSQPHIGFDRAGWAHFVAEIKSGRFQA